MGLTKTFKQRAGAAKDAVLNFRDALVAGAQAAGYARAGDLKGRQQVYDALALKISVRKTIRGL